MTDTQKNSLLTELTTDESGTINGGHRYSHYYCYCYNPCYGYRSSYWGGYYRYRSAPNHTVNVNVIYND